ncbi:RNAPII degradation factor [Basidiobolus ranarum]|uniref:RNA polymerase II degradation factor 1 n=1 Tax=Basidiobolus ranarum TaxID=34480 RepID=A0ABR2VZV1_9FUNG
MSSRVNPSTRPKSNKDEPDEVKTLRKLYSTQLSTLKELFAEWSDEDLLFATQEASGDLELAIDRISEGHTSQWGEVKGKKTKKPHSDRSAITQPHVDKYQPSVRNTGANERPRTSQIKSKSSRFPKPVEKPRAPASTFVKPVILDSQGTTKTYAQLASQSQRPLQDSDFTHTTLRNGSQNAPDISTWSSASVTTSSTPSWGPSKPEPQGRKTLDTAQPASLLNDYSTSSTIAKPSTQPKISWAQIVKPVAIPTPPVQAPKTNFAPEQTNQAESHIPSSETPSHEFSKPQEPQSEPKQESVQIKLQEQRKPDVVSLSEDGNIGTEKPDERVEDDVEEFKNSADVVTIPAGTDGTDTSDSKDHPVKLNTETSKAQALSPNTKARTMNARKFKQDSPVVMPGGNSNLERIGVQFGSLTLSSRPDRKVQTAQKPESNASDDRISEIPISEQSSTSGPEVTSQSSVPEMQPVVPPPIADNNSPVTTEVSNTALPTEGENELAKLDSPESSSLAPENVNGANNHTNALQGTQAQNPKVEMSSNNTQNQACIQLNLLVHPT